MTTTETTTSLPSPAPSPAPLVPRRLIPVVRAAHATITRGINRGGYAENASGARVGLHSSDAVRHDLAGALWLACGARDEAQRDADFRVLWDASKAYADKQALPDPKFASWLDERDKAWHLAMLAVLVGDAPAPVVPTPRATRDERIVQKYA